MTDIRGELPRAPARAHPWRDGDAPASAPARPTMVYCHIPSTVAAAVSTEAVERRARLAGVRDASLLFSMPHESSSRTRVVVTFDAAVFLLDEIHAQAIRASEQPAPVGPDLEYDCARAMLALVGAIERAT